MSSRPSRRRTGNQRVAKSGTPTSKVLSQSNPQRRWLRWTLPVVAVAAVAVLVIVSSMRSTSGGGGSAQVTEAPAASASVTGSSSGSGQVGERLASFELTSIDGEPVKVPAGKPGAVFFMAGWCGSCIPETKALSQVMDRFGGRISVLAVSPDPSDSVSALRQFRAAAGDPRYPFAWDQQGTLARAWVVSALDTTLVYDRRGKVVFRDGVPTDAETLEKAFVKAGVS